jgi:hypothetical protein
MFSEASISSGDVPAHHQQDQEFHCYTKQHSCMHHTKPCWPEPLQALRRPGGHAQLYTEPCKTHPSRFPDASINQLHLSSLVTHHSPLNLPIHQPQHQAPTNRPQTTPHAIPQTTPHAIPQTTPHASPQTTPHASPPPDTHSQPSLPLLPPLEHPGCVVIRSTDDHAAIRAHSQVLHRLCVAPQLLHAGASAQVPAAHHAIHAASEHDGLVRVPC